MSYKSFEEVPAWKAAIDLAGGTLAMTATGRLNADAGLKDQVERAVVSVSNNIAEGFHCGTHDELVAFLYHALGSVGDVRSMLLLIERLPESVTVRPHLDELLPLSQSVSRPLGGWIEALKRARNLGPRHQNELTRSVQENQRRPSAFMTVLDQYKHPPKPSSPEVPTDP